jgi:comEA protein
LGVTVSECEKQRRAAGVFSCCRVAAFFVCSHRERAKKHPPANSVELNSASAAELQQVPGIGPATAKSIVNFREKSGSFKRVEDLLAIRGISKQALERMRPYLAVNPPKGDPKSPN